MVAISTTMSELGRKRTLPRRFAPLSSRIRGWTRKGAELEGPRLKILVLAAGASAWLCSEIHAQPVPIPEAAKNRWYVDEADTRCFMSHAVEGGANRRLTVLTYPGSQLYDLVLESDVWPVKDPQLTGTRLELKPVHGQHWYTMLVEPSQSASGRSLRLVELPGSFLLDLSRANTLDLFNWQLKFNYPVPAGVAAATKALVDCQVTKMIEWGADPSGFGTGAIPVKVRGDPRSWFGPDFFDKPKSYRLAVRMLVSPEGRVERCDFLRSSVGQKEQASGCKAIIENARFSPARSPKGAPVRSVYVLYGNLERYRMWQHLPDD